MARSFNGSSEFGRHAAGVRAAYPHTVAGWAYTDTVSGAHAMFYMGMGLSDNTRLQFDIFNTSLRLIHVNATGTAGVASVSTVAASTWFHAAGVAAASNDRKVYLNAGTPGTDTTTIGNESLWDRTSFGRLDKLNPDSYWDGLLAEWGLWNVALIQAELNALKEGFSPLLIRPEALVAYWPLIGKASPEIELRGRFEMTLTGTAAANHPRMFYPSPTQRNLFAPAAPVVATPTTLALTLSTFAPTVTGSASITVTPTTAALTLTAFAPTVSTPRVVIPTTAALSLTTFAPTIVVGITVTPTTLALTLTAFAPTVQTPVVVTPGTLALTLTTFAPVLAVGVRATPTTAALALTAFAPTVSTPVRVTPPTLALTLTTFAPSVGQPKLVTPGVLALTLTAFAPTVTTTTHQTLVPGTIALTLALFAPTVSSPRAVTPATVALVLSTFAPVIVLPQTITPTTAALVITVFQPTILATNPILVTPLTAALTLTMFAPTILILVAIMDPRFVIYGLDNPTPMLYGFDAPTGPRVLKGGV